MTLEQLQLVSKGRMCKSNLSMVHDLDSIGDMSDSESSSCDEDRACNDADRKAELDGSTLCKRWVRSGTGKCFAQALYEAALGHAALCKLWSTKKYWEVLCASFVVRRRLGSTLCKLCSTK